MRSASPPAASTTTSSAGSGRAGRRRNEPKLYDRRAFRPPTQRGDMAASREEVYERVKEVLTEQLDREEAHIKGGASFPEDLVSASLELVELIMELEDQFGIKISDEDAQKIQTV